MILSDGGGTYLPGVSHSAAQHGILNTYQRLIHFLALVGNIKLQQCGFATPDLSAAVCAWRKSSGLSGLVAACPRPTNSPSGRSRSTLERSL